MGLVHTSALPPEAQLWSHHVPGDFIDSYSCQSHLTAPQATQIALQMPRWAKALLRLRNLLVSPLGLRTDPDPSTPIGQLFPITYESQNEVSLGFDDTHLNFRITIFHQNRCIYISTWVRPNRRLGRVYLALVMPFHILISRNAVRQVALASQPSPV